MKLVIIMTLDQLLWSVMEDKRAVATAGFVRDYVC